jgi:hypothetical protein
MSVRLNHEAFRTYETTNDIDVFKSSFWNLPKIPSPFTLAQNRNLYSLR